MAPDSQRQKSDGEANSVTDIAQAGPRRTLPRLESTSLFPLGRPTDFLRYPIFLTGNFRSLGRKHGGVHGESFEPLTEAPPAAGARSVELHDFRTLGADFKKECLLVARSFTVCALSPRLVQAGDWHDWRLGVRHGDNAPETWVRRVTSLAPTPPRVRESAVRAFGDALRNRA